MNIKGSRAAGNRSEAELVNVRVERFIASPLPPQVGRGLAHASIQTMFPVPATSIEGSRIKHTMGNNSIKMYDKLSKILRIETTTNDVSFFKHYLEVEHRDGCTSMQYASLKKNIYSLALLTFLFKSSNKRYLEFISAFDNKEAGRKRLDKVKRSKQENNRNYKGFNLFCDSNLSLLLTALKGEYNISGFRNKDLRMRLSGFISGKISRLIKRLKVFGLIKKAGKAYKYYLTKMGKELVITAEKLKETL